MKELLKEYYNVYDIDIIENKEFSYFIFQEKKYFFMPYLRSDEEFKDLILLNEELIKKGFPTAKFVSNKENSFITLYNNKKYVLLEVNLNNHEEYDVIDMIRFANQLVVENTNTILFRNRWAELWSSKIDYFEYQISQLGKDKPIILNSFSYYIGLAENAISYVNSTNKKYQKTENEKITLQRKRVVFPNITLNYFNPLNYVIDLEIRDIASYFKSLFFNSYEDLWIEVNAYLHTRKLSIYGYQMLYARLLYPSFYFDIYEKIMENEMEEESLLPIISKVDLYEQFLKDMYFLLSKYAPIERVEWLLNKKEEL